MDGQGFIRKHKLTGTEELMVGAAGSAYRSVMQGIQKTRQWTVEFCGGIQVINTC